MTKQAIRNFAKEKELPCLLHFTQLSNLQSILERGILSRDQIGSLDSYPEINDELRLDNHTDRISLSIAHPNSQMFYKYRREKGGEWCVLGIYPRILWSEECLFCCHNAADGRINTRSPCDLSGIDAFRGMFEEINGFESRKDQGLKVYDPTDVQAEILVANSIRPDYFLGVIFPSRIAKKQYKDMLGELQAKINSENKGYYAARSYNRKYR